MPTISEEQAAQIRQHLEDNQRMREELRVKNEQLRGVAGIWDSEKWGSEAKALWKKAYPDSQIPGYDDEQRVKSYISDFEKRQEDQKRESAIQVEQDRMMKQRAEVRQRGNYTDDGMKNLEAMMKEKNIMDYEAGDLLFRQKNPPPIDDSGASDSHYWNYDKQPQPNAQLLARDPEKWGYEELFRAVDKDAKQRQRF